MSITVQPVLLSNCIVRSTVTDGHIFKKVYWHFSTKVFMDQINFHLQYFRHNLEWPIKTDSYFFRFIYIRAKATISLDSFILERKRRCLQTIALFQTVCLYYSGKRSKKKSLSLSRLL